MFRYFGRLPYLLLLGFLVAVIAIQISPYFVPIPDRDSGVFLYIGSRILQGEVPYRDLWDHKAPFIYYVNAAGLWLAAGSRWGTWLLETLFILSSTVIGYLAFEKLFSKHTAFLASVLWIFSLPKVLGNGNFVQVYALFFQFASIYLWALNQQKPSRCKFFLLGICIGAILLIQPNLIPTTTVLLISLTAYKSIVDRSILPALRFFGIGVLGLFLVLLFVMVYFFFHNALMDFFDAVFLYNSMYAQSGVLFDRYESMSRGFSLLNEIGIISFLGWALGVSYVLTHKTQRFQTIVLITVWPLDLVTSSVSPKSLAHYYISWLPVMALMSAFFLEKVEFLFSETSKSIQDVKKLWKYILVTPFVFVLGATNLAAFSEFVSSATARNLIVDISLSPKQSYVVYLLENTKKTDYVYFWGNEPGLNFIAMRQSPSKYIYTYPLFIPEGYPSQSPSTRFMQDIVAKKPIIIDTHNDFIPNLNALDPSQHRYLSKFITYFQENYSAVAVIGPDNWTVYKHVNP